MLPLAFRATHDYLARATDVRARRFHSLPGLYLRFKKVTGPISAVRTPFTVAISRRRLMLSRSSNVPASTLEYTVPQYIPMVEKTELLAC
ncbi:hypothetical protein CA951_42065 [Rhodococcus sp. NCIMB 12038]|nr:hypothetical protein CA951_42065 [Rhodococcus sp. NCIMB 12038]